MEIGLALEARGIADANAVEVLGEPIEALNDVLRGRHASYGIVRLLRVLARAGVQVSLSVTPTSTMLRAGENRKVIRYREPKEGEQS
jgi:predicted XRE-type DNA-binding protein